MLSKTKLFAALDEYFETTTYSEKGLNAPGISDETYGRKSMIYINCFGQRNKVESFLTSRGFKVFRDYSPGSQRTEVQVSYFKGWHHDI